MVSRPHTELYGILQPEIERILQSNAELSTLVDCAKDIVANFALYTGRFFQYDQVKAEVDLCKLMFSLLGQVEKCGDESGQRYVAAAITACRDSDSGERYEAGSQTTFEMLRSLGITWLTHLLFTFRVVQLSEHHTDKQASGRLRRSLLQRDGYARVVTGVYDSSHPNPGKEANGFGLLGCHIVPRSIGSSHVVDSASRQVESDIITSTILKHVIGFSEDTCSLNDSPNGISLEINAGQYFNDFRWCFESTEHSNDYKMKFFRGLPGSLHTFGRPQDDIVIFTDKTSKFPPSSASVTVNPRKPTSHSIPLPSPQFLAIHAAMAEVMHASGAGAFFDEVLSDFRGLDAPLEIKSWVDYEDYVMYEHLRRGILEAFRRQI